MTWFWLSREVYALLVAVASITCLGLFEIGKIGFCIFLAVFTLNLAWAGAVWMAARYRKLSLSRNRAPPRSPALREVRILTRFLRAFYGRERTH